MVSLKHLIVNVCAVEFKKHLEPLNMLTIINTIN